jgi:Double zinc ribbon
MIKCSACALENPDDGKFCTGCGAKLLPPPPPAPSASEGPVRFCTECGAKIPPDSKFCTSCGRTTDAAAAGPGGAPPAGSGLASAAAYLAGLDQRLAANGFEAIEAPAVLGLDRFLRRKKFELAQIGMVTAVCGVKTLDRPASAAYVKDFSRAVFDAAASKKGFLARNALQQLLAYPVLVAPAVEPGVAEFLAGHWPKHWMAFEFTVVVSLGTREVLMHRSTPVYQALSHAGFKKQAESLFAF